MSEGGADGGGEGGDDLVGGEVGDCREAQQVAGEGEAEELCGDQAGPGGSLFGAECCGEGGGDLGGEDLVHASCGVVVGDGGAQQEEQGVIVAVVLPAGEEVAHPDPGEIVCGDAGEVGEV